MFFIYFIFILSFFFVFVFPCCFRLLERSELVARLSAHKTSMSDVDEHGMQAGGAGGGVGVGRGRQGYSRHLLTLLGRGSCCQKVLSGSHDEQMMMRRGTSPSPLHDLSQAYPVLSPNPLPPCNSSPLRQAV